MGEQKTGLTLLLILISLAVSITEVNVATADSRTLVVPDDYPTIASAIGNATDGDTVFVKKGTYDGPENQTVVIDKPISIIGEGSENTILNLHPNYTEWSICTQTFRSDPDAIRIEADDVRISNLKLSFIGEVRISGERVQIIDTIIRSHNTVRGVIVNSSNCEITDNSILGQITLEGSFHTIQRNDFYCLRLHTNSSTIKSNKFKYFFLDSSHDNFISGNSINTQNLPQSISMCNSNNNIFRDNTVVVTKWNTNLELTNCQNNTFYNNAFIDDDPDPHVTLDTASIGNFWNKNKVGNYWSNYNGTDSNADGVGDTPYIINQNNQDNHPLMGTATIPKLQPFEISISSPKNQTYTTNNVTLSFTVNELTVWTYYSLDGQDNVTITQNSLNLTDLAIGPHTLTVYATDTSRNIWASETFTFTVAKEPNPTQITLTTIALAAAIIAITSIAVIRWHLKNKHTQKNVK